MGLLRIVSGRVGVGGGGLWGREEGPSQALGRWTYRVSPLISERVGIHTKLVYIGAS